MRWLLLPSLLSACSTGFDKDPAEDPNVEPSTEEPSEPSTEEPSEPATEEPSEPSTEEPSGDPNDEDNDGDGFSINDGDCDDGDEDVNPDAAEIPGDGIDNDCEDGDEPIGVSLSQGDIIITEIMNNPSAIDDAQGEWFEIYNNTNSNIDLTGLIVRDMSNSESFEITMQLGFSIAAGSTATFGNNSNPSQNGGIQHDFTYTNFALSNSGDEIVLDMNGVVVDAVDYGVSGFPDPNGSSISLSPDHYDATANDDGANWCESTSISTSGDFGTPNAPNGTCAPPNPDADGDGYDGESFGGDDCNDNNPNVNPGAMEIPSNNTDDNCNGLVDEQVDDMDGDGYDSIASGGDDCDDTDASVNPGALEVGPNNIDENCDFILEDGLCNDTCTYDNDGACDDGGANASFSLCDFGSDCSDCGVREDSDLDGAYDAGGWPPLDTSLLTEADCDDNDPIRYPQATDLANDGIDQDCDGVDYTMGLCDDSCTFAEDGTCDDGGPNASFSVCAFGTDCTDCAGRDDSDQDGFYDDQGTTPYDNTLLELMDCDDSDSLINPDGIEIADDGIDQDCNGLDLLSICDDTCQFANDQMCDDGGTGSVTSLCSLGSDCSDCGSRIDEDADGYDDGEDCDDREMTVHPGVIVDDCNGVDNDCDGAYDEDFDSSEPSDTSNPSYLGSLDNGAQSTSGYLTYSNDVDAYTVYSYDGFFSAPDFRCDVTVPTDVDAYISLYDIDGNLSDTSISGFGGTGSVSFTGGFGDDTGDYLLVVETYDGMSCSSYSVSCYYD